LWGNCLATKRFPNYGLEPQWIWPPGHLSKAREARRADRADRAASGREHPLAAQMVERDDFGG
jgi:hypothetical protein